jgi:hypothetical protein
MQDDWWEGDLASDQFWHFLNVLPKSLDSTNSVLASLTHSINQFIIQMRSVISAPPMGDSSEFQNFRISEIQKFRILADHA